VFGGNQGGCDPDPPPPPGPSGPTWVNTFHHRDHLGSLRVTTDAAGWMLSGHDFYPFGMEVAESGQAAGGPSRMKFTGHERDDLTGLDYMKARYSGWFQASFLIPDPANDVNPRNPQSWNRYAYVRNNPMNLVDPEGLEGKKLESYLHDGERDRTGGELSVIGIDANSRGLEIDDGSKQADEANQKEEGKDPAEASDAVAEPTFDAQTEARLDTLNPAVESVARTHLSQIKEAGYDVKLAQGTRTPEEQDRLYAQGRTAPGKIVTNARGGESYHNYGVAYDVALFDSKGKYITDGGNAAYKKAGEIGEALGLEWGGRWKKPFDPPHFQLTNGVSLETMKQRSKDRQDVLTGK
jgi:peptidoglycan L-alanyl-D-glutamate endopeptidase CwlK